MKIEILGAESLGVRGLSCFVETENYKILIDPGIALGYIRHKLLPHPFQVAVDERIQEKIVDRWGKATDIVISHFHGDHTPLENPNPYQLNIEKVSRLNPQVRIWAKNPEHLSPVEKGRAESLSLVLNKDLIPAEGKRQGVMTFSSVVPHGEKENNPETVMMTRIEEDGQVFVHASDIQFLDSATIDKILDWKPNIVLASGPPIYLPFLSVEQRKEAKSNVLKLSQKVETLILDHHLLRSEEGIEWLEKLAQISKNKVICAADFMEKPRLFLEARRRELYEKMPVLENWHKDYAEGKAQPSTEEYWNLAKKFYKSTNIISKK